MASSVMPERKLLFIWSTQHPARADGVTYLEEQAGKRANRYVPKCQLVPSEKMRAYGSSDAVKIKTACSCIKIRYIAGGFIWNMK